MATQKRSLVDSTGQHNGPPLTSRAPRLTLWSAILNFYQFENINMKRSFSVPGDSQAWRWRSAGRVGELGYLLFTWVVDILHLISLPNVWWGTDHMRVCNSVMLVGETFRQWEQVQALAEKSWQLELDPWDPQEGEGWILIVLWPPHGHLCAMSYMHLVSHVK